MNREVFKYAYKYGDPVQGIGDRLGKEHSSLGTNEVELRL